MTSQVCLAMFDGRRPGRSPNAFNLAIWLSRQRPLNFLGDKRHKAAAWTLSFDIFGDSSLVFLTLSMKSFSRLLMTRIHLHCSRYVCFISARRGTLDSVKYVHCLNSLWQWQSKPNDTKSGLTFTFHRFRHFSTLHDGENNGIGDIVLAKVANTMVHYSAWGSNMFVPCSLNCGNACCIVRDGCE